MNFSISVEFQKTIFPHYIRFGNLPIFSFLLMVDLEALTFSMTCGNRRKTGSLVDIICK